MVALTYEVWDICGWFRLGTARAGLGVPGACDGASDDIPPQGGGSTNPITTPALTRHPSISKEGCLCLLAEGGRKILIMFSSDFADSPYKGGAGGISRETHYPGKAIGSLGKELEAKIGTRAMAMLGQGFNPSRGANRWPGLPWTQA